MLLTALAIKLEEGWGAPVLYRQIRVGERGQPERDVDPEHRGPGEVLQQPAAQNGSHRHGDP